MNELTTEIITHWAYVEKEDKKFPLTQQQADGLRDLLTQSTTTKYIMIPNPKDPFGEPLWEGRAGSVVVKRVEQRNDAGARFVCDFGIRHSLHESCTCDTKYGVSPVDFRYKMHKMFPSRYATTLTAEERVLILKQF